MALPNAWSPCCFAENSLFTFQDNLFELGLDAAYDKFRFFLYLALPVVDMGCGVYLCKSYIHHKLEKID